MYFWFGCGYTPLDRLGEREQPQHPISLARSAHFDASASTKFEFLLVRVVIGGAKDAESPPEPGYH